MGGIRTPANQPSGSIREYQGGVRFPCTKDKDALVEDLRAHDAPDALIEQVERLPATRFDGLSAVLAAVNLPG